MPRPSPVSPDEIESLKRFRGKPFAFLLKVASTHTWIYAAIIVLQIFIALFDFLPTYLTAQCAAQISKSLAWLPILALATLAAASTIVAKYLDAFFTFLDNVRRPMVSRECRRLLLRYTLYNSYDFFARNLSGKIASRINQIGESINSIIWNCFLTFGIGAFRVFVAAGALLLIKPLIALLFLFWAAGYFFCSYRCAMNIRIANKHLSDRESTTSGKIIDTLTNFSTLFNLGGQEEEIKKAMHYVGRELATQIVCRKKELQMQLDRTLWHIILVVSFVAAISSLAVLREITLPQAVIMFGLLGYCTEMAWVTWAVANLMWSHGRAKEQLEGLLEPYSVLTPAKPTPLSNGNPSGIRFDALEFSYPNGNRIFEKLTLAIPPGQHVGLVGRSGSGKTTFVNLLMRLYDASAGAVLINGVDLRDTSFDELRSITAVVPQDPSLFHRSILENVRFARPGATLEEIQKACRLAHAHGFIEKLPKGYDTLVGERGVKLSVGQRQRIAIARAILKDAPIVIFDEATSALDSESELAIQTAIHSLFENKTLIVIAHRLSTLREMDRILVFDSGKIVEDGTPAELLSASGLYAKFWSMQSSGFIGDRSGETLPPLTPSGTEE